MDREQLVSPKLREAIGRLFPENPDIGYYCLGLEKRALPADWYRDAEDPKSSYLTRVRKLAVELEAGVVSLSEEIDEFDDPVSLERILSEARTTLRFLRDLRMTFPESFPNGQ